MKNCIYRAVNRPLHVLLLAVACFFLMPAPEAEAIDPVTIAILAPIAMKVAEKAKPYVLRGLQSGLKGMVEMGKDVLEIFYLPLGVLESTAGAPFGLFGNGIKNCGKGLLAPCKLTWDTLLLPVRFMGLAVSSGS